jgi:glycosyltransferase involved in cell wall biosynthesis
MPGTIVILDQASGYLQLDMLAAMKQKYDQRVIIAGTLVERSVKLEREVIWHKIVPYDRSAYPRRIFTWAWGTAQMLFLLLIKYRRARVLAITNPPFSPFAPWLLGMTFDVLVYDLYPDALVQYGYLKPQSMVVRIWSSLNRKMFRSAQRIFTLSQGMAELISNYAGAKQVEVVPIWTDNEFLKPIAKAQNIFLEDKAFKDKFLIVYSGNLGRTHPVEALVDLAAKLDPAIFHVLIIGGGYKQAQIARKVEDSELANVTLLPWQPVEMLPYTLSSADLSIVTLDEEASNLSVPSKTFNIMSVGKPIMAIAAENSELSRLLKHYQCGASFAKADWEGMAAWVKKLHENHDYYQALSANSQKASLDFTARNALKFV